MKSLKKNISKLHASSLILLGLLMPTMSVAPMAYADAPIQHWENTAQHETGYV